MNDMLSPVVSIVPRLEEPPNERYTALRVADAQAYRKLAQWLDPTDDPSKRHMAFAAMKASDVNLHILLRNKSRTEYRLQAHFEHRIRLLERRVRDLLASGCSDDNVRSESVAALYGPRSNSVRDAGLLSDVETRLVEKHRALPSNKKTLLIRFLELLDETSQREV